MVGEDDRPGAGDQHGGVVRVEVDEDPAADRGSDRPARLGILVLSLLWALVPGFALIDLTTAIPPGDPAFRDRWFLEGSWGLFTTLLIVIPLLVVFFRPGLARDVGRHLLVIAGCCIAAAALTASPSYVALAALVAVMAAVVRIALSQHRASEQSKLRGEWWPLLAFVGAYVVLPLLLFGTSAFDAKGFSAVIGILAFSSLLAYTPGPELQLPRVHRWWASPLLLLGLAGVGVWGGYAWSMASEYRSGVRYTGLVDRIPAQSVLALAVVALPIMAALGATSFRLPVWTAALSGAGFGAFCLLYPDQLGSPGTGWGFGAIIWSALVVVVAEGTASRTGTAMP